MRQPIVCENCSQSLREAVEARRQLATALDELRQYREISADMAKELRENLRKLYLVAWDDFEEYSPTLIRYRNMTERKQ